MPLFNSIWWVSLHNQRFHSELRKTFCQSNSGNDWLFAKCSGFARKQISFLLLFKISFFLFVYMFVYQLIFLYISFLDFSPHTLSIVSHFHQPVCPVGWGCRIHQLLLCRGVRPPPTGVLDMTLNNLMVRFQQCWSFGECGVPLYCNCFQVHSGPEW